MICDRKCKGPVCPSCGLCRPCSRWLTDRLKVECTGCMALGRLASAAIATSRLAGAATARPRAVTALTGGAAAARRPPGD